MDCPFCDFDKQRFRMLHEGRHVYVMLSTPRIMRGHVLVIPKRHVLKPSELGADERRELFDTALEFQERILARLSKGCDIRQHYKPFVKQGRIKMDHVHVHLMPREPDDELYVQAQVQETPLFKDISDVELRDVLGVLRD